MRFVNMSVRQALKCDADRGRASITEGYQESSRKLLNKSDIRVEIETNGAVDIAPLANAFSKEKLSLTMDYKLPSSGCEEKMLLSNMEALRKQDTVKFVSGSINDLECAEKIIENFI